MKAKRSHDLKENIRRFAIKASLFTAAGFCCTSLIDHNGGMDSPRTSQAIRLSSPNNPIKTVASVYEEWEDSTLFALDGTGYNPLVIRHITFEDGTETGVRYRTLAWQPFRRWIRGDEFSPQKGEQYEVTLNNNFVRKIN